MKLPHSDRPLHKLDGNALVYPISPKPSKELSVHDAEPLKAQEWIKFFTTTPSDAAITDSDTDSNTASDVDSDNLIAAYVVYHGRKMGVFRKWPDVQKSIKGVIGSEYQGFSSVISARRSWTEALGKGTWGSPGLNNHSDSDDEGPIVTLIPSTKTCTTKDMASSLTLGGDPSTKVKGTDVSNNAKKQPIRYIYDDIYYVVFSGCSPGVYYGRDDASRGLGTNGHAIIYKAKSRADANERFVQAYSNSEIVVWDTNGFGHIQGGGL